MESENDRIQIDDFNGLRNIGLVLWTSRAGEGFENCDDGTDYGTYLMIIRPSKSQT